MADSGETGTRWLSATEMRTWRALMQLLYRLPAEFDAQLQQDCQLRFVEYYALAGLSDRPHHTMRMSELAIFANSELSRLSHLIRRLEDRGFVRREPDSTDGRYTNAILTEAGYAHLVKSAPSHVARVRELVFDALDDEDLRQLTDIAARINARIDEARGAC